MKNKTLIGKLQVSTLLVDFINDELLPKLDIKANLFWSGFETIINDFTPRNTELLLERDVLQEKIDEWHRQNRGQGHDPEAYKKFLFEISISNLISKSFEEIF